MSKNIETYEDFGQFYEVAVAPLKTKNPDWVRLDGSKGKADVEPFAYFYHNEKKWRVDPDTHFDKLKIAYGLFAGGQLTFKEQPTSTRKGTCLVIADQPEANKMFYVYLV